MQKGWKWFTGVKFILDSLLKYLSRIKTPFLFSSILNCYTLVVFSQASSVNDPAVRQSRASVQYLTVQIALRWRSLQLDVPF